MYVIIQHCRKCALSKQVFALRRFDKAHAEMRPKVLDSKNRFLINALTISGVLKGGV